MGEELKEIKRGMVSVVASLEAVLSSGSEDLLPFLVCFKNISFFIKAVNYSMDIYVKGLLGA